MIDATLAAALGLLDRECVVLDDTSGTTRRRRVQVTSADGRRRVVFVKTPAISPVARGLVNFAALGRAEIGFYRNAAPAVPLAVPRCSYAHVSGGSFTLVLDDLVTEGATPGRLGDELPISVVEQALVSLAQVHGTFWEDRRLASPRWSWCRSFVPTAEATVGWLLAPALSALGRRRARRWLPDEIRCRLAHYAARRTPMARRLDRGRRTLVHHDCHPGNLAQFADGRVVLFDWQLVRAGPWASDVAYLLSTSLSTDERRAHERPVIECYLDSLLDA